MIKNVKSVIMNYYIINIHGIAICKKLENWRSKCLHLSIGRMKVM
jgi:hypothetical protein